MTRNLEKIFYYKSYTPTYYLHQSKLSIMLLLTRQNPTAMFVEAEENGIRSEKITFAPNNVKLST